VRIAEFWRKVPVVRRLALFQDGSTVDITDFNEFQKQMLPPIVRERDCDTFKVEMYRVTGSEVLDGPHEWAGKYIPLVPVIGGEFPLEEKTYRYSAIRFARDPQQLYNYYRTAHAELLALQPKAPYLVTTQMLANPDVKAVWDQAGKKNLPYLPYDADESGAKPERLSPPQPSVAMVNEGQLASDDMKATTGIYDASVGARSNETSGVAIGRRDEQADTANYHFIDNLQRSLEHAGRILIDLIPKVYDNERVLRLMPENGNDDEDEAVAINRVVYTHDGVPMIMNDLSAAAFDIRVTIGKAYATRRMEAAEGLFEFAKALQPQHQAVIADLIAKNIDIPEADEMAKRLRRMVPPQVLNDPDDPNAPPVPPDPAAQAAEQAAMLELRKMELEVEKGQGELDKVHAEIDRVNAQINAQINKDRNDAALEAQKLDLEERKGQMEIWIEKQRLDIERMRADLEREKLAHQANMDERNADQAELQSDRDFTLAKKDRAAKSAEKSKA
jgi:hypothetical protein